jgi:hypothetical protein
VAVIGVWGIPVVLGADDFGPPSEAVGFALTDNDRDEHFLWPRRKALAEGGGKDGDGCAGELEVLGGDPLL